MSILHDDDARAAITASRNGITCETCACGRIHVRLRYEGKVVGECVATIEQLADAAEIFRHVAQRLGPGFASQYAAPAVAEGCIILAPGKREGTARLAIGADRAASVSVDVTAEEVAGVALAFGEAAQRSDDARSAQDDRFEHATFDASVLASVVEHPESIASAGCSCGCVHLYATRHGAIALRLDLTPEEARAIADGIRSSADDAERLAAAPPKTN